MCFGCVFGWFGVFLGGLGCFNGPDFNTIVSASNLEIKSLPS